MADAYVAPKAIEVISKDKLIDVGNGEFTATVDNDPALRRQDGSAAEVGDVLSCQEDGSLQTRPQGTTGNFERCKAGGGGLYFRPVGTAGRTYFVPYTDIWPNG